MPLNSVLSAEVIALIKLCYLEKNIVKSEFYENIDFDISCDVLCVGLGTAGVFCALSAAREGAKVVGVEKSNFLGGTHTAGNVCKYYYGFEDGTFQDIDKATLEDDIFLIKEHGSESKHIQYIKKFREYGADIRFRSFPTGLYLEESRAVGVRIFDGGKTVNIRAKKIIDGTGDGHLIRMTGVKTFMGRNNDGNVAPFTVRTQFIEDGQYHSINADSGFVNQYEPYEYSKKIVYAHANALKYTRNCEFLGVATMPGVREGISFEGEETLRMEDIVLQKNVEKPLFYAYSDFDRHGKSTALDDEIFQNWSFISNLSTVTARIAVPMGVIVPRGISSLVTVGRCLSGDTYSRSAVRMIRDMSRMGECIGIICAMAAKENIEINEVDYGKYTETAKKYGCFLGDKEKTFGFDYPGKRLPYKPVEFDFYKNAHLLKTETPGIAIWAAYIEDGVLDFLFEEMSNSSDELYRNNCAIALGLKGDKRALSVLRDMVKNRNNFYFKDCRRTNGFPSAIAMCLLGRIGEVSDIQLLSEIIFDNNEPKKEIYQNIKPDILFCNDENINFLYFTFFTYSSAALLKIYKRYNLSTKDLYGKFLELYEGGEVIKAITNEAPDKPNHIEISNFFKYILAETK